MKSRKTVLRAAALVLAACGLAGCGGGTGGGSAANATGPLTVWIRGSSASIKAYQAVFASFTQQTGIRVAASGTLTDFDTKISAAEAAHQLPDLVIDNASQLGNYETQGILQQIRKSDIADAAQLTAQAWASVTDLHGDYYAVPFSAQANVLLVRSDWLSALKLPVPTTWAQVEQDAIAFTQDHPAGPGQQTYGIDVPGTTATGYVSWWWSSLLWQAGGDYVKSDGNGKYTATLDSPAAVAAAREFEKLACTDKVVQPGYLNDSTTAANKAFQTGQVGMYLTGPYAYATSDATGVKGRYVAVAPPRGPASAETLAEGTSLYLMAGAKTDETLKLESFMTTPAAQKLGMTAVPAATVVRLPVNSTVDAATVHKGDPRWALAEQVYRQQGHYEYDSFPNWTALRQLASDEINTMMASCASPSAAMADLNTKFQAMLRQQGIAG
ncbi:MAG TPA: extracellular solute-binding protein [Actinospica sp.]|nr:extracellular solute-binding protein [Actinospica sp.]